MVHLQIREIERYRHYEYSFQDQRREAVLVAAERFGLEDALKNASLNLSPNPWSRPRAENTLSELLESLAPLLPGEFPQEPVVRVSTDEAVIPWELVFPDSLVVRAPFQAKPAERQPYTEKVAACVVHPGAFPLCQAESRVFETSLRLEHPNEILLEAPAGFCYLAVGLDPEGKPCLPEPLDLARWLPRQLNRARRVPAVLFLRLVDAVPERGLLERADALVQEVLKLGIETVITNFWEPEPEAFRKALEAFYRTLKDSDLLQAIGALRAAMPADDPFLSRYAIALYGRAEVAAEELSPLELGTKLAATTAPRLGKPDFRIRVLAGPERGRTVPIFAHALQQGKHLIIGSPGLKRCQIEIQDPELANEALKLELEEGVLYVSNLGSTPDSVKVEGLPVYSRIPLRDSLTVESGATQFVLEMSATDVQKAPQRVQEGRFRLVQASGPPEDASLNYELREVSVLVGREGAFALHDPSVSRRHTMILERDGSHYVCVLGQAPVILNGIPVEKEAELKHGDLLQLSDQTTLKYVDGSRL